MGHCTCRFLQCPLALGSPIEWCSALHRSGLFIAQRLRRTRGSVGASYLKFPHKEILHDS